MGYEFKVGDKVTVIASSYGTDRIEGIKTVEKVLKTTIVVDGTKYTLDGHTKSKDVWSIHSRKIVPTTDEHRKEIRRLNLIHSLSKVDFKSLSYELLTEIKEVMVKHLTKEKDNI